MAMAASECGDETGDGGDVGLEAQDGHGAEENNDGKGSDECGKLPDAGGVVALRPVSGGGVGGEEVDQAEKQREEGCGFKGEGCGVERVGGGSGLVGGHATSEMNLTVTRRGSAPGGGR